MKNFILLIVIFVITSVVFLFPPTINASDISTTADTNNVLLEYCTGTWCGYCPCGHAIIRNILTALPNTVVVGYHGGSGDPWISYSTGMISLLGFSAYPTGVVGRTSGIISRSSWFSYVVYQSSNQPGVRIDVTNKLYNQTTRQISANVVVTALSDLPAGSYYINQILIESNIVYPQYFYEVCGTPVGYHNDYVHHHVNKGIINGTYGTLLTSSAWNQGTSFSTQLSYTLPTSVVDMNCDIVFFVYKQGTPYSSNAPVQNALDVAVSSFTTIGIKKQEIPVNGYELKQNFPNPFNPTTNIHFTIPKDEKVILKVFDVIGNEVATCYNGFLKAGSYNVEFDGTKLASGIYYYQLRTDNFVETKKMILVK
ncbi:MAG: Omp28-related outer membrane protein [Ignavibacteria bacterium]|nr:Omp28-related outer membrane protein [Ignavibacteria bacterium]